MPNTINLTRRQLRFIIEHYRRGFIGFFGGYTQETGYVESNWPHRHRSSSASDDGPINVRLICILYFVGLAIAVLITFVIIQYTI